MTRLFFGIAGIIFAFYLVLENDKLLVKQLLLITSHFSFLLGFLFSSKSEKNKIDVFSPSFFFIVIFIYTYILGSWRFIYFDIDIQEAIIYTYLGSLSFYFGVQFSRKNKVSVSTNFISLNRRKNVAVLLLFVSLSLLATIFLISKVGLPFLQENQYRFDARRIVSSYVVYVIRGSTVAFYFYFAYNLVKGTLRKNRIELISLFFLVALINIIPGWRGPVIMFVIANLIIYHYLGNRINIRKAIITGTIFLFSILIWGFQRNNSEGNKGIDYLSQFTENQTELFFLWFANNNSVYMDGLVNSINLTPEVIDFKLGTIYLNTIGTVLPGEQKQLGDLLKEASDLQYQGGGLNPTIIGEFYIDFGIFGVLIYSFSIGLILNNYYKKMLIKRDVKYSVLYVYLLTILSLGIFTGVLGQAIYTFNFIILIIISKLLELKSSTFSN